MTNKLDINTIAYKLPIDIDADKIRKEIDHFLTNERTELQGNIKNFAVSYSITNAKDISMNEWFDRNNSVMPNFIDENGEKVTKHYDQYTLGFPGEWKDNVTAYFADGTCDKDLIHWRSDMIDSEIYRLTKRIEKFFNLDYNIRCRSSFFYGPRILNKHSDPHTPWRVHVTLKSGPETRWEFIDIDTKETITWKQPPDSVWLIRTGNVQHRVIVPENESRVQLFYHLWNKNIGQQYHQIT